MNAYTLHAVKKGSVYIPAGNVSIDPGLQALVEGAGGSIDVTVAAVGGTKPVVTFSTPALGTAAGVASNAPVSVGTGSTLVLYFAKLLHGGTYASGSVHTTVTINDGALVCNRVNGEVGKAALADYTVWATFDGTNDPYEIATDVALPTADLLSEIYVVHSAVISYLSTSVQAKLQRATVDMGWSQTQERCGADIHPTFAAVMRMEPQFTLETNDAATMLGVIHMDPLVSTGTVIYFAKMDGPTFADGAVHLSITANDPLVKLSRISANQNIASLTYDGYPVYQDATVPITFATNASLPTGVSTSALFTVGPVTFNSTSHESTSWDLDTGMQVERLFSQGAVYPQAAAVIKRETKISGDVLNVDGTVPTFGESITDLVLFLRKIPNKGTRTAEATAEHISFTAVASLAYSNQITGTWGQTATQGWTASVVKDGANANVAVDTTAAIAA